MPRATPRLTPDRWIDAALEVIAARGVEGVAVEGLARRLGVSKGSFYWHFADRATLIAAAVAAWEAQATTAPIAEFGAIADPRTRLSRLLRSAFGDRRMALDAALAARGDEPAIAAVVSRVTARRLAFLADAYAQCGLAPGEARRMAQIAYSTYLGHAQLARVAPDARVPVPGRGALMRDLLATLVPPAADAIPPSGGGRLPTKEEAARRRHA